MRFMIIEKTRISNSAMVSAVFSSASEAREYGYNKPTKKNAKLFHIKKGFKLIDKVCPHNDRLEKASVNIKEFKPGKINVYLRDPYGFCEVEEI